jgi:hypothetical protein
MDQFLFESRKLQIQIYRLQLIVQTMDDDFHTLCPLYPVSSNNPLPAII